MTRLYVAGGSSEARTVLDYINKAKDAGYDIVLDWASKRLEEIEKAGGQVTDTLHSREERLRIASLEREAVERAEIHWLLMPQKASFGGGWEMGYQHGLTMLEAAHNRISIVSGPWLNSIFSEFANHVFDTHDEALAWLVAQQGMP